MNDDLFDAKFGDSDVEQNGDLEEDNSPKSPTTDWVGKPVESNSDREPQDSRLDEETSIKTVDERQKQEALTDKVRKYSHLMQLKTVIFLGYTSRLK